ncbi:hypothetical protein SLEP1_g54188 [Rubroshorea leprosula]|uniref:Transmembrane protein n=1 Tax=Rubroshorea leprosula TaxID=152421 RepID=A0AAV5MBL7_9ROSI|nr:hypothetical protein SLEP1_g54188 [Rubroshorea leprosula]
MQMSHLHPPTLFFSQLLSPSPKTTPINISSFFLSPFRKTSTISLPSPTTVVLPLRFLYSPLPPPSSSLSLFIITVSLFFSFSILVSYTLNQTLTSSHPIHLNPSKACIPISDPSKATKVEID